MTPGNILGENTGAPERICSIVCNWYVVSFTYKTDEQAQNKTACLPKDITYVST